MNIWHGIGRQLKRPHGVAGRAIGHAMRLLNRQPNQLAIAALAVLPTDHVLELGYGPGEAVASMAQLACDGKVCGIDASAIMHAQALRRNARAIHQGRVQLVHGDFACLPWDDGAFDKILAVNVAYFWNDPVAILAECRRVLRPGGTLSIYATDAQSMQHWKFADRDTHRLYTAPDLYGALRSAGFAPHAIHLYRQPIALGIQGLLAVVQADAHTISLHPPYERSFPC